MTDKILGWQKDVVEGVPQRMGNVYKVDSQEIDGTPMSDNSLTETVNHMFKDSKSPEGDFLSFFKNFKDGDKVLMLGSGENGFVLELKQKYPKLTFISADLRYFLGEGSITKTDNMVSLDWNKLPISRESVDGIFCHFSFPYWNKDLENVRDGIGKMTDIVKQGGRWLFDGTEFKSNIEKSLRSNGWKIEDNLTHEQRTDAPWPTPDYFVINATKV